MGLHDVGGKERTKRYVSWLSRSDCDMALTIPSSSVWLSTATVLRRLLAPVLLASVRLGTERAMNGSIRFGYHLEHIISEHQQGANKHRHLALIQWGYQFWD